MPLSSPSWAEACPSAATPRRGARTPVDSASRSTRCGRRMVVTSCASPDSTGGSPESTGGSPDSTGLEVGELGADRPLCGAPEGLVDILVDDLDHPARQLLVVGVGPRDSHVRQGFLHLAQPLPAVHEV